MIGNASAWGSYFFLSVTLPWKSKFFLIKAYFCSYNTFKSRLQLGDVNRQLSTKAHIACAAATGENYMPRPTFLD